MTRQHITELAQANRRSEFLRILVVDDGSGISAALENALWVWPQCEFIGALVCDVSGIIVDANRALTDLLGFPSSDDLRGKSVCRVLQINQAAWGEWKLVAGDGCKLLNQEVSVAAQHAQALLMQVQIFAAPNFPDHLQAIFVDRTEEAILTARWQSLG